mgnify:CR=1 FL=1
MKEFKMYFFSPECGGSWLKTSVYAKTLKEARKTVSNLYYVDERKVFAQ